MKRASNSYNSESAATAKKSKTNHTLAQYTADNTANSTSTNKNKQASLKRKNTQCNDETRPKKIPKIDITNEELSNRAKKIIKEKNKETIRTV